MSNETNSQPIDITTARPCKRCKGEGKLPGILPGEGIRTCTRCEGRGNFPGLDVKAIVDACFTTRGGKKFRKSFTSPWGRKGSYAQARAYFVWRLCRFHGGADVTMPITAMTVLGGDPFEPELDAIAGLLAKKVYGTDLAAASRWGTLLGFVKEAPAGLPASAYEGGPVADGNKPAFEAPELR